MARTQASPGLKPRAIIERKRCAPEGHAQVSGLKPARGCASIQLVIETSFYDDPSARGTGASSPRTSVPFLDRAQRAHHSCPNHSPGLQSWEACAPAETRRGTGAPRPGLQSRFLTAPKGRSTSALIIAQDFSPGRLVRQPEIKTSPRTSVLGGLCVSRRPQHTLRSPRHPADIGTGRSASCSQPGSITVPQTCHHLLKIRLPSNGKGSALLQQIHRLLELLVVGTKNHGHLVSCGLQRVVYALAKAAPYIGHTAVAVKRRQQTNGIDHQYTDLRRYRALQLGETGCAPFKARDQLLHMCLVHLMRRHYNFHILRRLLQPLGQNRLIGRPGTAEIGRASCRERV